MFADYHMHTNFSTDTDVSPTAMIDAAIAKGVDSICITDHYDKDYVNGTTDFTFDIDQYFAYFRNLQDKYQGKIKLRIGVEIGLQMHLGDFYQKMMQQYPFDFVIGSAHFLKGQDPYYKKVFQGVADQESYQVAFQEMKELVGTIQEFDVLGHMDYIVRYGNQQATHYSYAQHKEVMDEILRTLIETGRGIEVNTAGWKYGLDFAHPHPDILKRYKELGGEIITIGSDAHNPEHVAYEFERARKLLIAQGFKYYTEFIQRKPNFCNLS